LSSWLCRSSSSPAWWGLSAALEFLATTRNPEGTLKTTPEQVLELAAKFEVWIKKP